ncbi:hypothetical protein [Enterococcus sp. HY326]|uniref:hypothetical protein n=1 Tax=Enterococcus sp. HY326 TaxID=2971265 RepID=UPI002240940D|nr:hypothetical protein [Enterococcus sp. HY326]
MNLVGVKMRQILLLTKNFHLDNDWETKFENLGYEVFCSSMLVDRILIAGDTSFFSLFKIVVLSESITDEEVAQISSFIKKKERTNHLSNY